MDAITLLKQDHKTVEALFKEFERLGDKAKVAKRKIVAKVIRELAIHSAIEEAIFYPAIRAAAAEKQSKQGEAASDMVLESLEEHHIVKWVLSELEKMGPEEERFEAKMTVLMENVRHHVEEEEEDLFPKVQRLLKDQLEELGERMEKAKKIAPTRPHPRAPDQPPGNLVATTVAAVMDRSLELVKTVTKRVRGGSEAQYDA